MEGLCVDGRGRRKGLLIKECWTGYGEFKILWLVCAGY